MTSFANLDLLSVGVAVASTLILGFVVLFNNPKSATGRTFFLFSLVTILWGTTNYLQYQIRTPELAIYVLRLAIFFAVWHAFCFFKLFYIFPADTVKYPRWYKLIILPTTIIISLLNLTPFVFNRIGEISADGRILKVINGPGIVLFTFAIILLVGAGIFMLVRKIRRGDDLVKRQLRIISIGAVITFSLIVTFNFVFPALLDRSEFIQFGALFLLPLVAFTFYAIVRHKLLAVKVLSTEILTMILSITSFVEIIISETALQVLFRSGVFILILSFGILLIKSVIREVKQREELKIVNDKLQIADRMKTQFLSFASHQVKSPMTVVKDYAELIMDGSYGEVPDKVKNTAEKIKEAANRLLELVTNLLDLRKLEEGKVEYRFESIDLGELVASVVEEQKTVANTKSLELSLEPITSPIKVNADKEKLRQVIQNLIDNSIKYTEKGWIHVKLSAQNAKARITVADSGMGIPQDLIPKLFEQFNRGSAEAKKIQGTGLGLYVAKQFMEAHHGKVWAESEGPGKGSTFIVEMDVV